MFKDRDLFIIGAGALLAIFCLLLPFSFAGKVMLGLTVLILFMGAALLRFEADRIPLEEYLKRKLAFKLRPKKHVYQHPERPLEPGPERETPAPRAPPEEPARQPVQAIPSATLALEGKQAYTLAGIFLALVGVYFLVWLAQGGAATLGRELALLLQTLLHGDSP